MPANHRYTFCALFLFFELHFLHLRSRETNSYILRVFWVLNEMESYHCLAHRKCH